MRLLSLLLVLFALSFAAHAQGTIYRCIGAGGQQVFTDQPCTSVAATPAVPAPTQAAATGMPATVPMLCAASMGDLRQAVTDAFAAHDANRLAGLVLWEGRGGAVADIRQWTALVREPLLDFGAEEPATEASSGSAANDNELLVHTASRQTRFGVRHHAGCLWLAPPA
jgi:hypothetical protein